MHNKLFFNVFDQCGKQQVRQYHECENSASSQTVLEVAPPASLTRIVYVNKGGVDTGSLITRGDINTPFLSVSYALSVITDASRFKRYVIMVGPGTYSEDVHLKANVFLVGTVTGVTLAQLLDLDDPSWAVNEDNRSGIRDISILGPVSLNFNAETSQQGKFYTYQCRFNDTVTMTAFNTINQCINYNTEYLNTLTVVGGQFIMYSCSTFGDINVNSSPLADTYFYGSGGGNLLGLNGTVSYPTFNVLNPSSRLTRVDLSGFAISGYLNIVGDTILGDTEVYASAVSVPPLTRTAISNNGTLTLLNYANGIGYIPVNNAVWLNPQPQTVNDALNRIAQYVYVLGGNVPIP